MKKPTLKQLMKRPALWITPHDNLRISMPTTDCEYANGYTFLEHCDEWIIGITSLEEIYECYEFVGWL